MADRKSTSPRIVIVGAGLGGILTAIAIEKQLRYKNFTIYEKASETGGVWRDTTYPGSGCDVPSHWYSLSTELNPNWSALYARQPEINAYWQGIYKKHNLASHTVFNTAVMGAVWDNEAQLHHLTLKNSITGESTQVDTEILIWAVGRFMAPRFPTDINGMERFKGVQWHCAQWRHDVDLKGKRVGVIGNGCSASQLIPEISESPSVKVINFCRNAQWYISHDQFNYPSWVKWVFAHVPFVMRMYRNTLMLSAERKFTFYWKSNTRLLADFRKELVEYVKATAPEKYHKWLIPNFPPGCRRIILDASYLKSLSRPNVEINWDGIDEVVENGIRTKDGDIIPLDVIIYATGFAQRMEYMNAVGSRGISVDKYFDIKGPTSYLGLMMPGFPNLFRLYGPNTSTGAHASIIFVQEVQVQYLLQIIKRIIDGKARSYDVTDAATDEYNTWLQARMGTTVWEDCESWYRRDKTGTNVAIFPGLMMLFWWKLRRPRWDHFVTVGADKRAGQGVMVNWVTALLLIVLTVTLSRLNNLTFMGVSNFDPWNWFNIF